MSRKRWALMLLAGGSAGLVTASSVAATPVAPDANSANLLGRVIQEPLKSTNYLQLAPKAGPAEFTTAFTLLQQLYPRYIRLSTVAAELGDPRAVSTGPDGIAAGAPGDTGDGLPLHVITLTDRSVPDKGKAYVSLMFAHAAEPCGREGVLRSVEDLAQAATRTPQRTFDDGDGTGGRHQLTAGQILARTKVFITVTSPDGWAAGDGTGRYSQYNGGGVNSNRLAHQPGWVFDDPVLAAHHYTTATQAEGLAVTRYLMKVRATELGGRPFTIGADLHGPLPTGLILQHDQGNDPVKLRRSHDLAQRVKQRMDRVFAQYATHEGASAYATAASYAAPVRDALLAASPTSAGNTTGVGGAGATAQVVLGYPLQWAQISQIWDLIGYTGSGAWGGWMNSELGADTITYEINCAQMSPWVAPLQQLYQDNVRAIVQTNLVQAATRAATDYGTQSGTGRVGYYDSGRRVTSRDGNPRPVPVGFPGKPLLPQLVQRPYDVSPTDYFRDLGKDLTRPLRRVDPLRALAPQLAQLDTLVVADQDLRDLAAVRRFVAGGGNLVLTDRALAALPGLGVGRPEDVKQQRAYVGYADLDRQHPFAEGLAPNARQTYDPIGLGYQLLMERDGYWTCESGQSCASGTRNDSPVWSVRRGALPTGSQVVGTVDPPATATTTREGSRTDRAEIAVIPSGRGRIVTFGALLPYPTEANPHYFGLEGYTISYAGQQMLLRAMEFRRPAAGAHAALPALPQGRHATSPRTDLSPASGRSHDHHAQHSAGDAARELDAHAEPPRPIRSDALGAPAALPLALAAGERQQASLPAVLLALAAATSSSALVLVAARRRRRA